MRSWSPARPGLRRILAAALSLAAPLATPPHALAQNQGLVVRDGSMGSQPAGPVLPGTDPEGEFADYLISEDLGERRSSSLLHSFSLFSVGVGETATFTGSQGIENIVGRVTGSDPSLLEGRVRSTIEGADLYLLNPAGVVFGSGATVDLKGAFRVSTSDSVLFSNGEVLWASVDSQIPVLQSAVPAAFGLIGEGATTIALRGPQLSNEGGFELYAGEVRLEEGALLATALQSAGESSGDIDLRASRVVSFSGTHASTGSGSSATASASLHGRAGSIRIEAPEVALADGAAVAANSLLAGGAAGEIEIHASESLRLGGRDSTSDALGSSLFASSLAQGDSGSIHVEARSFEMRDGAVVAASSLGSGAGGRIALDVEHFTATGASLVEARSGNTPGASGSAENVTIGLADGRFDTIGIEIADGSTVSTRTNAASGSEIGGVTLRAEQLVVRDGSLVETTTEGAARAGAIQLDGETVEIANGSDVRTETKGSGDAGSITITAADFRLRDGSNVVSSSGFFGTGSSGDILVRADDSVLLSGIDAPVAVTASALINGSSGSIHVEAPAVRMVGAASVDSNLLFSDGDGGDIVIRADREIHLQGSDLAATPPTVSATTSSGGNAGDILFSAPRLRMTKGSRVFAATLSSRKAGRVFLDVEELEMSGGASLLADSVGAFATGDAGNVAIGIEGAVPRYTTSSIRLSDSSIRASSSASDGGSVRIAADEFVLLEQGSAIEASVTDATGGSVVIGSPVGVVLRGASAIRANAPEGQGGDILIDADVLLKSPTSTIEATGEEPGTVRINTEVADIENRVQPLSTEYLDASQLLGPSCAARPAAGRAGELTVATWPALLPPPDAARLAFTSAEDAVRGPVDALRAISNDARAAIDAGEYKDAEALLDRLAVDVDELPQSRDKAEILIHSARSREALAMLTAGRESSLLQAHAALSRARTIAEELRDDRLLSYSLGDLAALYGAEHRFGEALRLTRWALRVAERANAPDSIYRWHWQLGQLYWDIGQANEALRSYERAVAVLEASRQPVSAARGAAIASFRDVVRPVYLDLVDMLLTGAELVKDPAQREQLLLEARSVVERMKAAELRNYFRDDCVIELEAQSTSLEGVSASAAIVYPISLADRIELLVTLPSGLQRFTVPVGAEDLEAELKEFRRGLKGVTRKYREPAATLYDWLVRPYRSRLDAEGIDTLVFVPDGALREVPMSALYDGEEFLLERFALAVTPGLELTAPGALDPSAGELLLAGVSEAAGDAPPLPHVAAEIEAIQGVFGGTALVDEEFTVEELRSQVRRTRPAIVHIASHAEFTGNPESSYIQARDGRISMESLSDIVGVTKFGRSPLELLVLSACETAAGDDRSALGLAGVAIRSGARSAVGSLWSVSDRSTAELMEEFYRQLKSGSVSKADALRRAQLRLLEQHSFRHPRYWSPFLLINNWL